MIFFISLLIFGVIIMLFSIYQVLSEINDNLLDFDSDICRGFIINHHKKKGKK